MNETQPALPADGMGITLANRIVLLRRNSAAATRYALRRCFLKAEKEEFGDGKKKLPTHRVYELLTLTAEQVEQFTASLKTRGITYEIR